MPEVSSGKKKKRCIPRCGKDAHKLFKWLGRLSKVEFNVHFFEFFEVCCERREVVRVVPLPGWGLGRGQAGAHNSILKRPHPLVVVTEYPCKTFDIALRNSINK